MIGVGNTLFGDDGVGFYFAEALKRCSKAGFPIEGRETLETTSLEMIEGVDTVIFIDAGDPKSVDRPRLLYFDKRKLEEVSEEALMEFMDPHDMTPIQLVALGYKMGVFNGESYFLLLPAYRLDIGFGLSERSLEQAAAARQMLEKLIESLGEDMSLEKECFTSVLQEHGRSSL